VTVAYIPSNMSGRLVTELLNFTAGKVDLCALSSKHVYRVNKASHC
jgi:hypothetical protein